MNEEPWHPHRPGRPELPDVRGPRRPVGYRGGARLRERLQGLGIVLVGIAGALLGAAMARSGGLPMPGPASRAVLYFTPLSVLGIVLVVGAIGLMVVGVVRMVNP